jgi:phosphoglucosamine mutase
MRKLFGTDGVRGVANIDLTPELAFKLGRVGSYIISTKYETTNNFIIIGKDTRQSSEMLSASISSGICSIGVDVWDVGVVPTPVVSWLVKKYNAKAGVMISASHNPAKDNGIKFFNSQGYKLDDNIEVEIENLLDNDSQIPRANGDEVGRIYEKSDIITSYINYLDTLFDFSGLNLKIGIDTANGAAFHLIENIFNNFDIDYKIINNNPNGKNINLNCGSTNLESIKDFIKKNDIDLGLAFDGDADRLLAVDGNGNEITGDHIIYFCSKYLDELKDNKFVVGTVMSNQGIEVSIKELGKEFIRAKVGDRYVLEEMIKFKSKIGGEQSGHIIFYELNNTGDGILTSLMLLKAIKQSNKTISELYKEVNLYPQILLNLKVSKKDELNENKNIKNYIKYVEEKLGNTGRVLVRASGTEPLIRILLEGKDKNIIDKYSKKIYDLIKKELS